MATFRTRKDKENPYVMLNKNFLQDKRLSFKAKGILAYLLSKPDDWRVMEVELSKASRCNRDAVRSGVKELVDVGYIVRTRVRDEKGLLRQAEYDVYELPQKGERQEASPEEKLIAAFNQAGAPGEITAEVKEMTREAIEQARDNKKFKLVRG